MTNDDAIKIIGECKYCRKKVDGSCISESECFEAKQAAIEALKHKKFHDKLLKKCDADLIKDRVKSIVDIMLMLDAKELKADVYGYKVKIDLGVSD